MRARAKLNLRLEVLGRRSDGYHEIQTLMHTLDLADEVGIDLAHGVRPAHDSQVTPSDLAPPLPPGVAIDLVCTPDLGLKPHLNLAYRAAAVMILAWVAAGGQMPPDTVVSIRLTKRIPVAAGLGGGSADAAAVLRGLEALLRRLEHRATNRLNLHVLAESLGSDIPFLLRGGAAVGVGRGERLFPVESWLDNPVLLAAPPLQVSAGDAYAWLDAESSPALAHKGLAASRLLHVHDLAGGITGNDLTIPVARRFPVVQELIGAMRRLGAAAAEMTGSGPVVFGLFAAAAGAQAAEVALHAAYPQVRTISCGLDARAEPVVNLDAAEGEVQ